MRARILKVSLTIGSLFSGIGGLELGLQRGLAAAGVPTRTLWQVEQNDYARAVLGRHWPHAERYTDVRNITAATVQPIDLLAGGFPCQDLSYAGKGAGLAGERSGLFFEMARIVRELRPRIVVLENVPAINTRGVDTVLGTLAALGYAARWGGLRASEVGAPHRRERWFCVAWLADHDRQRGAARARLPAIKRADLPDPDRGDGRGSSMADTRRGDIQLRGKPRELGQAQAEAPQQRAGAIGGGQAMADARSIRQPRSGRPFDASHSASKGQGQADRANDERQRQTEPGMGGGPHGISRGLDAHRWPAPPGPQHPHEPPRTRPRQPHDRDRLKALGNAVVPQCAEIIGRWIGCELVER